MTLKDFKRKLKIWDKAQREAARRRKFDWVKSLGEGVEIPTVAKSRGPNYNALAHVGCALLSRSTSAPITFLLVDQSLPVFFVKRGSDGGQSSLFPVVDFLIRSGDIGNQTLKLSKIALTVDFGWVNSSVCNFFVHFFGPTRKGWQSIKFVSNC